MSVKSQTDFLKFAQNEISRSKRWRDQDQRDDDWKRWIDLYRGRQYEGAQSLNDRLIVNVVFATVNVLLPAVAINNPKFTISARNPKSQAQAILTQEILNYLWRTNKYQPQFKLAVLDFVTIGHGWLKVGYKWTKEPEVKEVDPSDNGGSDSANTAMYDGYDQGIDDREDKEGNVESELNVGMDDAKDRPLRGAHQSVRHLRGPGRSPPVGDAVDRSAHLASAQRRAGGRAVLGHVTQEGRRSLVVALVLRQRRRRRA